MQVLQKNPWAQNNGIRIKIGFVCWWNIDADGPNDVENVQHINDSYEWMNEWTIHHQMVSIVNLQLSIPTARI